MASLVQLFPLRLFFVAVFGFLPIIVTVYQKGIRNISWLEWLSFAVLAFGVLFVYVVSGQTTSVEMQRYILPALVAPALGLLLYRTVLLTRGEFDDASVQRGGTDYE